MTKTEQELTRIQGAKSALRDAILAKGGTLNEDARIDEYAPAVQSLAPPIKLKDGNNFNGWSYMTHLPTIDVSELTTAYALAYQCHGLETISLDMPMCKNASHLATDCRNLQTLRLNMPQCTNVERLAYGCRRLHSFQITVPQCINASSLAMDSRTLERLELDLPECTNAYCLAYNCSNLQSLTLNIPKCTNAEYIVSGCTKLSDAKISGLQCSLNLVGTAVTIESVQYIVEHAQEAMEGAILTLPRAIERSLPEETMEMALEKGFEVAFR